MVPLKSPRHPWQITPFISRVFCSWDNSLHPSGASQPPALVLWRGRGLQFSEQRGRWTSESREENKAIEPLGGFLPRKVPLFALSLALWPRHDQRPLGQEARPLYGLLMDLPSGHLTKCPCLPGRGRPAALPGFPKDPSPQPHPVKKRAPWGLEEEDAACFPTGSFVRWNWKIPCLPSPKEVASVPSSFLFGCLSVHSFSMMYVFNSTHI